MPTRNIKGNIPDLGLGNGFKDDTKYISHKVKIGKSGSIKLKSLWITKETTE